jgi:acetyl esterase
MPINRLIQPDQTKRSSLFKNWVRTLIGDLFHMVLTVMSISCKYLPSIRKRFKKLKISYNQPYGTLKKWHYLDIYELNDTLPDQGQSENLSTSTSSKPAVLYIHGGGFRILSKDTHWSFAMMFAEAGFVVFNINYRLAPKFPCPAGLSDAAQALLWLINHAEAYGVDPSQIYIAGESAGGNLATSLALCCVRPSPYKWSQDLFEKAQQGWKPRGILPACAFLDLTPHSKHRSHLSTFIQNRIEFLIDSYLQDGYSFTLANPLIEIESDQEFHYNLPPFFISIGSADFIVSDSERLALALQKRQVDCIYQVYPKGIHAFHAVIWTKQAQKCWQDCFNFLASYTKTT